MNLTDLKELERALYFIPATIEREKWIEIGDALKTAGISFEVFDHWSSTGDGYNAKTCRQQWKSFNGSHKAGTLIYYAMQYGYGTNKSNEIALERARAESQKKALQQARLVQEAALRCFNIWQVATDAHNNHPYLVKKQVPAIGLRIDSRGHLLVPILNANNQLQSLQIISPQGEKLFTKNSVTAGGFYQLGTVLADSTLINITEGYATAATIAYLTQQPVFIAFSASNLTAVAQLVRKRHPKNPIIICADNDRLNKDGTIRPTDKNTGIINAQKAAQAINATVCIPYCSGSDFNDLFCELGADECLKQLKRKVLQVPTSQIVRSAIALLLQNPHLAKSVIDKIPKWEGLEFQGLDIFKSLLHTILNYPAINTNDLIKMYRGLAEEKVIQTLADQKFPFSKEGVQAEFLDAVDNLIAKARQAKIIELLEKEKNQSLNATEKYQLNKMLIDK